jgi:hypothetical protein
MFNEEETKRKVLSILKCTERELITLNRSVNFLKAWEDWSSELPYQSKLDDTCHFARLVIGRSDCDLTTAVSLAVRFGVHDAVAYDLQKASPEQMANIPALDLFYYAEGYIEEYIPEMNDGTLRCLISQPTLSNAQRYKLLGTRKEEFIRERLKEHDRMVEGGDYVLPFDPTDDESTSSWFTGQ